MSTTSKTKEVARGLQAEVVQSPISGSFVSKPDSLAARVICTPAVQSLYSWARAIPILGEFLHMFVRRALLMVSSAWSVRAS